MCVNFSVRYLFQDDGLAVNDTGGIMSDTFKNVLNLIQSGDIIVSSHGYDELTQDAITVREIISGAADALVVEDYPNFGKGPCTLVLQLDRNRNPIHVVWGIPKDNTSPVVLITAYRPDPNRWSADFLRRKS